MQVALITGFIISGLIIDLETFPGQGRIGVRYWKNPYPLFREYNAPGSLGRFLGFWSTMISAAFAYGNVQVVAIAGAETRNPRKSIPKALKRTFFRVIFFYVLSVFVISLLVPADDPRLSSPGNGTATESPFVIALGRTGNKVGRLRIPCLASNNCSYSQVIPSFVNAVVRRTLCPFDNWLSYYHRYSHPRSAQEMHAPSLPPGPFTGLLWTVMHLKSSCS
jgi:amino acid transporter